MKTLQQSFNDRLLRGIATFAVVALLGSGQVLAQDEVVRVQRRLTLGARGAEVPGIIITEPLGDFST